MTAPVTAAMAGSGLGIADVDELDVIGREAACGAQRDGDPRRAAGPWRRRLSPLLLCCQST
jgi:hypothetical protein